MNSTDKDNLRRLLTRAAVIVAKGKAIEPIDDCIEFVKDEIHTLKCSKNDDPSEWGPLDDLMMNTYVSIGAYLTALLIAAEESDIPKETPSEEVKEAAG